jgi:hypothetical protein
MRPTDISRSNVLDELGHGCRTIWDLASAFTVSANHDELKRVVKALLADGAVVASGPNLYTATLEVIP